ncbi:hypothetical protein NLI96_g2445 [Meripilus lineatus]|uniref:F-box domain-containing protein n=1 Tax=Meripilus lineatus TaxID=2056292 RepID=A0AAD5V8C5_9APHY|nr:hypothetical protein NLI96_g2445 [Physisporinus lineatus]
MSKNTRSVPLFLRSDDLNPETRSKFEDEVTQLKRRVNAITTVSRLSDDILVMIFTEGVNVMTEDDSCEFHNILNCPENHSRPYGWIYLAHVCHHWRTIVLQMAVLWSNFVVGDLGFTERFLALSKTAPLTIKISLILRRIPTYLVFDAFSRIQAIELDVKIIEVLNLETRFPREAPILRKVVLRNFEALQQMPYRIRPGEGNFGDKPIPGIFDHCPLPSLTSLSIEGFIPDWQNHIFTPFLTCLTVRLTSQNKYGTGCMFDALDQMKNLRLLDLAFECVTLNWLTRQTRRVSLPKLEDLVLHDSTESCVYLFERLEFPTTTTVSIHVSDVGKASPFLPSLFAAACSRLSVTDAPRILTVGLWNNEHVFGRRDHFAFWDQIVGTRVIRSFQPTAKPLFHIEVIRAWDWISLLTMGLSLGPVSNTQVLFIGSRISWHDDPWEIIKESIPKVHTLHLRPPNIVVLERLLARDILHKSKRTNKTQPFFANLQMLVISEVRFNEDSVWCLENGLSGRKESGRPIHTLELHGCERLDEEDVDSFREYVDQVIWEKVEGLSDDGDDSEDEDDNKGGNDSEDDDEYDYGMGEFLCEREGGSVYQSSDEEL